MANKLRDENLHLNLIVNGDKGKKELGDLEKSTRDLTTRNKELRAEKEKLIRAGKQESEEYKAVTREITENNKSIKTNETRMAELRKEIGITGLTMRQLREEQTRLKRLMDNTTPGTEQYKQLEDQLKAVTRQMGNVREGMGQTGGALGKLEGYAKGLLPAFGFAAIAAGAMKMAEGVKNSTDDLSTQWEIFMGGMKGATNEFFRTLATGDWSNFKTNMRDAIAIGREYQRVLDELEAKQRALSLAEADARQEILELEDAARNRSLSDKDRLQAAERRIQLEEELAAKRTKIATEAYEMEEKVTMQQTRLSKERLMEVLKDMDSETKARAVAYNEALKELQSYSSESAAQLTQSSGALYGKASAAEALAKIRMKELEVIVNGASDATKVYAEAIAGTGKTTDEQLDKMVKAYADMKNAEVSALENTRQVRRQMYSIMAQEQDESNRNAVSAAKMREAETLNALDSAYKERQLYINQQYVTGELNDKEHKARLWIAEMAYLEQKKALLQQMGKETLDIELQIINQRMEQLRTATAEMLKMRDEISSMFDREMQKADKNENDDLTRSINESIAAGKTALSQMNKNKDEEAKINAQRTKTYLDLAASVGDSFDDLLLSQEGSFGDFLKNTLVMALDALEKILLLKITEAIMDGTVKGPLGIAMAVGKIVLMKAAFATAKAGVLSMGGKQAKGKKEGGFTTPSASDNEIADFVHANEWVGSAQLVRNPDARKIIDVFEYAQRTGNIHRLNMQMILNALGAGVPGKKGGGYTSPTTPAPVVPGGMSTVQQVNLDVDKFNKAVDRLTKWEPTVAVELFERKMKQYREIIEKSGL